MSGNISNEPFQNDAYGNSPKSSERNLSSATLLSINCGQQFTFDEIVMALGLTCVNLLPHWRECVVFPAIPHPL